MKIALRQTKPNKHEDVILPYRVVDARYHTGGDYEIMFASNEKCEAIAAAREAGDGAAVIKAGENNSGIVIFINSYKSDLGFI